MNLQKLLLTKNDCYLKGVAMTPMGIMVHSTGANNPTLKRYVNPDDGLLGLNLNNNHWNRAKPDNTNKCAHAFIGKLANGNIATYQTLPWEMRGWHAGSGTKGTANNGYISFEICEDSLTDKTYFDKVYKEAVELAAMLCKKYNIKPEKPYLICHSEGKELGIASAHADVMHWFPKHGKSMDTFRADVAKEINFAVKTPEEITVENAVKDGVIADTDYWLNALYGKITVNKEKLKEMIDKYHLVCANKNVQIKNSINSI